MTYIFLGFFTKTKVGTTPANAPTIDICNIATNDLVVTNDNAIALTSIPGLYTYTYTGAADLHLAAVFKTIDTTVDQQHVTSYPAEPPTAAAIADQVWDEAAASHIAALTTGALLTAAATDPLTRQVPAAYTTNSAGAALGRIAGATITIISPVAADGTSINLIHGDDYYQSDGRAISFTNIDGPTLTNNTVALRVITPAGLTSISGTITDAHACYFEITKAQIASMGIGMWSYNLEVTMAVTAHAITLVAGNITISRGA